MTTKYEPTKKISEWQGKTLEVGFDFDVDQEIELSLTNTEGKAISVWIDNISVYNLIKHLENALSRQRSAMGYDYVCKVCGKGFDDKENLYSHYDSTHNKQD